MKSLKIIVSSLFVLLPLPNAASEMDEMETERQRLAKGGSAYCMRSQSRQLDEDHKGTQFLQMVGQESRPTRRFVAQGYIPQPSQYDLLVDYLYRRGVWMNYKF